MRNFRTLALLGTSFLAMALLDDRARAAATADAATQGHVDASSTAHDAGGTKPADAGKATDAGKASDAGKLADGGKADGGTKTIKFKENEAQKQRRHDYNAKLVPQIRTAVHANNKAVTGEERTAIGRHWGRMNALWRIRGLAEEEKDDATVARVDALIKKMDERLFVRLKKLNAKAPVKKAEKKADKGAGKGAKP